LNYPRWLRYYYLRFIRLRGDPHELALGTALGIFAGLMPIMPFQTALSVTLALFFKGSKITAALGTWVSNPLNWYFLYHYSYKIGTFLLGFSSENAIYSSLMAAIRRGDEPLAIIGKMIESGSAIMASFLAGGLLIAILGATPSYFLFLWIFKHVHQWRLKRRT